MPRTGLLVVCCTLCALLSSILFGRFFAEAVIGSDGGGPEPRLALDGLPAPVVPAPSAADGKAPIVELGDAGWFERTLRLTSDELSNEPIEIVVEVRFQWRDGEGHIRITGRDVGGEVDDVLADERRRGSDLVASLAQFQRMYDEVRTSGADIRVVAGVTVAEYTFVTSEAIADDRWRLGRGDPGW